MLLLLSMIIVGCSSVDKKTEVKTNEPIQEQKNDDKAVEKKSNDTVEDKKTESKLNEDSENYTSDISNDKAKKSTEKTSKTEDASTKNNQTTSQSSTQSNSTSGSSNSQPSETTPTPPVENVVPDKQPEQEKPKKYKVGNCGKLYNTESEARAVADANNGTFTDTYFISGYFLYSTYDKWSFDYYYTYFE